MHGRATLIIQISIFFIYFSASAAVTQPYSVDDEFFVQTSGQRDIRIMSLNSHNLYDTEHDEGYFDYTYLPMNYPGKEKNCEAIRSRWYRHLCLNLDWTPSHLNKKLHQLVKLVNNHGSLPDILALQEIENDNVASLLADRLGYDKFTVTDQRSKRGQDVALFWNDDKLEMLEQTEIPAKSRDPLRIKFRLRGTSQYLFVYVNHWPAQLAPTRFRVSSAMAVRADIDDLNHQFNNPQIILVGDFNVTFDEEEEVINQTLLDRQWKYYLSEVHQLSRKKYPEYAKRFPDGSYWRGGKINQWQRFDRIFVSSSLLKGTVKANLESYRIIYSEFLTGYTRYKANENSQDEIEVRYPLPYNFLEEKDKPLGFSDHLPVTLTLSY